MNRFSVLLLMALFTILLVACSPSFITSESFMGSSLDMKFNEVSCDSMFEKAFLVWVKQPLDHNNLSAGYFWQRIWLSHLSVNAPVVMVTEGYGASANYVSELAGLLNANQIIVEHRYFGESVSDSLRWEYLTVEQAAKDHHRIIKMFKRFYKGNWITTGISKGGQTAMIHRAFFSKDVDLTVTYVAPFNLSREDSRLISFFDHVATEDIRTRVKVFQTELLKRRIDILPLFKNKAEEKGLVFSMEIEKAFELCVLEYPFSLFQWCVPPDDIPGSEASANELFEHFYRVIDFSYFSEQEKNRYAPFFYQAYKELGYYSYLATSLLPYMNTINTDTVSSDFMIPINDAISFVSERPFQIYEKLKKHNPEMIHIVGQNDPWSSTSPDINGLSKSYKFIDPDGCHLTRISTLPDTLRVKVYELINNCVLKN